MMDAVEQDYEYLIIHIKFKLEGKKYIIISSSFSLSECEKKIVNERINLNNHIAFLYPEFNENIKTKLLEEK